MLEGKSLFGTRGCVRVLLWGNKTRCFLCGIPANKRPFFLSTKHSKLSIRLEGLQSLIHTAGHKVKSGEVIYPLRNEIL